MRISAYRDFQKSMERLLLLYEATMHSYNLMYETGRQNLRSTSDKQPRIVFKRGSKEVPRLLRVITYHARDVYPELLRSTMLVRLVAAYEAFLVDCVEEVSTRSKRPFYSDGRIDFSQEQLLTIDASEGIYNHIVKRTLRRLTSGGLKEIRKFYQRQLGTDLFADPITMEQIEEIHDRRHLFVHRAGFADAEYVTKHPGPAVAENKLLKVTDEYFLNALTALGGSGLYIKKAVEALFPAPTGRTYVLGNVQLPNTPENLNFIALKIRNENGRSGLSDLSLQLEDGQTLRSITVWLSDEENKIRMLVGTSDILMARLHAVLYSRTKAGSIELMDSFKIKR